MAYLIVTSEGKISCWLQYWMELGCNLGDLASIPGFVTGLLYGFEQITSQLRSFSSPICEKQVTLL